MPHHEHELPEVIDQDKDVFRLNYRPLHDEEIAAMRVIKLKAADLLAAMDTIKSELHTDPRCAALAKTRLEEAVFWFTKAITGA